MARRHVVEAVIHVRRQRELLARLEERALPTKAAGALLDEFERCLADHRRSLRNLEEEQRLGVRDSAGLLRAVGPASGLHTQG